MARVVGVTATWRSHCVLLLVSTSVGRSPQGDGEMIDKDDAAQAPVGLEQQYVQLFTTTVPDYQQYLLPVFAVQQDYVSVRTVTTYGAFEAPIIG